jgi:hypothetical protein
LNLPGHYKRFYRTHLRFALVMMAIALLAGISFQESGRKVLVTPAVPVGAHLEFLLALALVHGHAFLTGVVLPLAFAFMLHLERALDCPPLSERSLSWTTRLYLPGAAATVLLQLLKGYHLVLGVRHGAVDFTRLNDAFLGGNHAIRAGVYGLAHGAMGLGMAIVGLGLWRSLKVRPAAG